MRYAEGCLGMAPCERSPCNKTSAVAFNLMCMYNYRIFVMSSIRHEVLLENTIILFNIERSAFHITNGQDKVVDVFSSLLHLQLVH